jgi:glycosyltransferase involved in cell wall biosynthesis
MRIIFVGRLIWAKGCQDLIAATKDIPCEVVIVGDGNYSNNLRNIANGNCCFLGELSHEQVMKQLSASDIFVNPSYSEGLPTSVMEAAVVGLPIIATDVGGTKEIIEDGTTGMLYKPGDVEHLHFNINYLIQHPDIARVFGIGAKQSVITKFSWDKITEQYIELIQEVVKREYSLYRLPWLHSAKVNK